MNSKIMIGAAVIAVALWWFSRRKDATENAGGPTLEIQPDAGSVSMDSIQPADGENLTRDEMVSRMIGALSDAAKSQAAASATAYDQVVAAMDSVTAADMTYEQRSQAAASQAGSAVVRAQVVSAKMAPKSIVKPLAPVSRPSTSTTLKTAASMPGLKPVGTAGLSAKQQAVLNAQRAKKRTLQNKVSSMAKTSVQAAQSAIAKVNMLNAPTFAQTASSVTANAMQAMTGTVSAALPTSPSIGLQAHTGGSWGEY